VVVLIHNTTATLRRRDDSAGGLNSHGERVGGAFAEPVGDPLPALIEQRGDGGWSVNLDDALWPVRQGDAVISEGRVFIIRTADHLTNAFDSTVNYVRCEALRVNSKGTEPQDSWFVGRDL